LSLVLLEGRAGLPTERSMTAFAASMRAVAQQESADNPRRPLYDLALRSVAARQQLFQGHAQAAVEQANAAVPRLLELKFSSTDPAGPGGFGFRTNILRNLYQVIAIANLEQGHYVEAEKAARSRNSLPPNRASDFDPQDETSRTNVLTARALIGRGRLDEARSLVEPELARYRKQQKSGAHGTTFQLDLVHAWLASALAQPATAAGRSERATRLEEAERALGVLPAQAHQLFEARMLSRSIHEARQAAT
jgi:hypothetical protein